MTPTPEMLAEQGRARCALIDLMAKLKLAALGYPPRENRAGLDRVDGSRMLVWRVRAGGTWAVAMAPIPDLYENTWWCILGMDPEVTADLLARKAEASIRCWRAGTAEPEDPKP